MKTKLRITALTLLGAGMLMAADCSKNRDDLNRCTECTAKYQGENVDSKQVCTDEEEKAFRERNRYYQINCPR